MCTTWSLLFFYWCLLKIVFIQVILDDICSVYLLFKPCSYKLVLVDMVTVNLANHQTYMNLYFVELMLN